MSAAVAVRRALAAEADRSLARWLRESMTLGRDCKRALRMMMREMRRANRRAA